MLRIGIDAAAPRERTAIAQDGAMKRCCLGCGKVFGAQTHGRRLRCEPCSKERKRFVAATWQHWHYHNDAVYRARERKRRNDYRRADGIPTRAESDIERRKRGERIVPKIHKLQAKGLSCAVIGERLGLSKNAVIGLLHRARKRDASRDCAIGEKAVL